MADIERFTRSRMAPLLAPYGLCEAVRHGRTLAIAGQTGLGADHALVAGGIRAQAAQAFRNIAEIVALAGGRSENLVSFTWYLAQGPRAFMEDALDVTAARDEIFPGLVAGSTAVRVAALLMPEILVEIQAVCAL
jgi:2-iminobutanoate/2-iminopropanoate deaminase